VIHTETPVLATEGARTFNSYLAQPERGSGPGLVIFCEMWGLAASKREMADNYARQGWCVLVPNVFWQSAFPGVYTFEQYDEAWQRLDAFDFERSVANIQTAVRWLRASPHCSGKVAAIGFCMGGRLSFLAASRAGVDAAISLYALGIAKHLDEVGKIACPLQLHYGLTDRHVPQSEIDAVSAAAQGNGNVEILLYPGAGHAFFSVGRPTYDAAATATATARIDRMLARLT
jgi:carboxymethylenebutenolidase